MECNKLLKEALDRVDILQNKWVPDEEVYNLVSKYISKNETSLDYSIWINDSEELTVNPKVLSEAIIKEVPELKDYAIQKELRALENIIPTDSYIKRSDYHKYVPSLNKYQKAAYESRKGTGYLHDLKMSKSDIEDFSNAGEVVYDVGSGKLTKSEGLYKYNKTSSEPFDSYEELKEWVRFYEPSQEWLNKMHDESKVVIDKDLYVTRADYFAGSHHDMPDYFNVSALLVDPHELEAVAKDGIVIRIPAGNKVAFVEHPSSSKLGHTEVVLKNRLLKSGTKAVKIKAANRMKDRIINRYKKLGGTDINKLFAITPLAILATEYDK